jgi:hypothetical protein
VIHVTNHAVLRFQERVEFVSIEEVRERLNSPVIQQAAEFGAPYVRLPGGQCVLLQGHTVITILPADYRRGKMSIPATGLRDTGAASPANRPGTPLASPPDFRA